MLGFGREGLGRRPGALEVVRPRCGQPLSSSPLYIGGKTLAPIILPLGVLLEKLPYMQKVKPSQGGTLPPFLLVWPAKEVGLHLPSLVGRLGWWSSSRTPPAIVKYSG